MSLWRGEPMRLRLDADSLTVEAAGQSHTLPFSADAPEWPAALATHVSPGARIAVRVADHHVRYLVVQWPAGVRARRERDAWLVHQFNTAHGLDMTEWTVAIDRDPVNDPRIACALPTALLTRLSTCVEARRAAIVSLTGAFIDEFNHACRAINASDGALVVTHDQRMTLGVWRAGRWPRVVSQAIAPGDDAAARRALLQLRVTGEAAVAGVLYTAGEVMQAPDGWTSAQAVEPRA